MTTFVGAASTALVTENPAEGLAVNAANAPTPAPKWKATARATTQAATPLRRDTAAPQARAHGGVHPGQPRIIGEVAGREHGGLDGASARGQPRRLPGSDDV